MKMVLFLYFISLMGLPKMEMAFRVFIEELTVFQLLKICKLVVHHCIYKNVPLDALLNQLNPKLIFRAC
jgi:hypothetical protein